MRNHISILKKINKVTIVNVIIKLNNSIIEFKSNSNHIRAENIE